MELYTLVWVEGQQALRIEQKNECTIPEGDMTAAGLLVTLQGRHLSPKKGLSAGLGGA